MAVDAPSFEAAREDASLDPQAAVRRGCVLILGAHRSGSSALTKLVSLMGPRLPKTLMLAGSDNPRGFYESHVIMEINDAALAGAGRTWNDWEAIDVAALPDGVAERSVSTLVEGFRKEFGDAPLVVLKDPRTAPLSTLWLRALDQLEVDVFPVLALRPPIEAAASLHARNDLEMSHGLLLWARYMLDAERATRGLPRAWVDFGALLEDPHGALASVARLLREKWPSVRAPNMAAVAEFLDSELRHHRSDTYTDERSLLRDLCQAAYTAMSRLAVVESAETHAQLDEIAARLEPIATTAAVYRRREQAVQRRLEAAQRTIEEQRSELADHQTRHDAILSRLDRADSEAAEAAARFAALRDELATIVREAVTTSSTEDLERLRADFGRLQSEAAALGAALAGKGAEVERLKHQLAMLEDTAAAQSSALTAERQRAESATAAAAARESELFRVSGLLAGQEAEVARSAQERSALEAQNASLQQETASLREEIASLQEKVARLEAGVLETGGELAQRAATAEARLADAEAALDRERRQMAEALEELKNREAPEVGTLNRRILEVSAERDTAKAQLAEAEARLHQVEERIRLISRRLSPTEGTTSVAAE